MSVEQLKKILNQFPNDMEVLEGPNAAGAADFQVLETVAEETILLIVPIV